MMVAECTELDIKIATKKAEAEDQETGNTEFQQYVSALNEISKHEKAAEKYRTKALNVEEHVTQLMTASDEYENDHPLPPILLQYAQQLHEKATTEASEEVYLYINNISTLITKYNIHHIYKITYLILLTGKPSSRASAISQLYKRDGQNIQCNGRKSAETWR